MSSKLKIASKEHHINHQAFRQDILEWYGKQKRILPWRSIAESQDMDIQQKAYAVWLSEIMLQQTVVKAVKPYFEKFLSLWPDVKALAAADDDELMQAWAGLGYYSRARNLLKCARVVAYELDGNFPDTEDALIKLPGIGPYTAAAIAAIAFNKPATVIDGNVDRIIVRLFALDKPIRDIKPEIRALSIPFFMSDAVTNDKQHSHFAQSLMDLGAGICIPKAPRCMLCPVRAHCLSFDMAIAPDLPVKPQKKVKPHKYGDVYIIKDKAGRVLIEKRADKGLLASTFGFPTSEWTTEDVVKPMPSILSDKKVYELHSFNAEITHVFTHFSLSLRIKEIRLFKELVVNDNMIWIEPSDLKEWGMPSLFTKVSKFVTL
jgi:A/G-specific adenine glycosylase